MRRTLRTGLLLLTAVLPAAAQDDSGPAARVDANTGQLFVVLGDVLSDGGLVRALNSGLPLRIRVSGQLWRDGFFDSQEGEAEWGASVIYDPVARLYEVAFLEGEAVRRVPTLAEATALLEDGFSMTLRPAREARYYYRAHLEIETLSLSDLEELQRWLRGDLAPAVEGERGVESAVASGIRRIFVRALGLPAFRERLNTRAFDWVPRDPGGTEAQRNPAGLRPEESRQARSLTAAPLDLVGPKVSAPHPPGAPEPPVPSGICPVAHPCSSGRAPPGPR